ncbi:MAG TPA: thiolase family protein [Streptosporangiaceae bacterium]|nr:thiolase family protein [Streptosporangiaceae bacterium]
MTFIVDAVRTPIGRHGGALAGVRPDDLAAGAIAALLRRTPDLDPAQLDDLYFGDANGAGEDNRNVARMAGLLAGVPPSVPGATINRLCGSGLEAAIAGDRAVLAGDAELIIAGGVESMSRAPWVLPKPDRAFARGHETAYSTTLGWRMVNPRMPEEWTVALGEGAEILADKYAISRADQDAFALRSHQRAAQAWAEGRFGTEVEGVDGLDTDEGIRADSSLEKLARLKAAFRPDGTVTAGNSSQLSDGAAALLLASEQATAAVNREPLARIAARAASGVEPQLFGIGPVTAARTALKRAGITWSDLSVVELNEAFAAQSLACLAQWPDLDPDIVNVNGGAIALGHPLGCSGARILGTLAHELRRRGGGWGLAAICIGVGQGLAVVLEA